MGVSVFPGTKWGNPVSLVLGSPDEGVSENAARADHQHGSVPASAVAAGTFPSGTFSFSGSLDVSGTSAIKLAVSPGATARLRVSGSVVEIGRYLDFHNDGDAESATDYDVRLDCNGADTLSLIGGDFYTSGSVTASTMYTSSWFRSTGATGWYSETYTCGIYASESNIVRTYQDKDFRAGVARIRQYDSTYAQFGHYSLGSSYQLLCRNTGLILIRATNNGDQRIVLRTETGGDATGINSSGMYRAGGVWSLEDGELHLRGQADGNHTVAYNTTPEGILIRSYQSCGFYSNQAAKWSAFFGNGNRTPGDNMNVCLTKIAIGGNVMQIALASRQVGYDSSTIRHKKDVRSLRASGFAEAGADNPVFRMRPTRFKWIDLYDDEDGIPGIGVANAKELNTRHPDGEPGLIAEEVYAVAPDAVTWAEANDAWSEEMDGKTIYHPAEEAMIAGVRLPALVAYLIDAVQHVKNEQDKLVTFMADGVATHVSSQRFKVEVGPLTQATDLGVGQPISEHLNPVFALRPLRYHWNEAYLANYEEINAKYPQGLAGLIAEEVAEGAPDAVTYDDEGLANALNTNAMLAYIIGGLQHVHQGGHNRLAQMQALETQMGDLVARVTSLEGLI